MEGNSSNPTSSTPVPSIDQPIYTPPNQSQPLKKASKFSIKAIIGTIIFLLLAGGAAAGFIYREPIVTLVLNQSSSPTPTLTPPLSPAIPSLPGEDWMWYTNDIYDFAIKYPPDWNIESPWGMQGEKVTFSSKLTNTENSNDLALVTLYKFLSSRLILNWQEVYSPFEYEASTKGEFTYILMAHSLDKSTTPSAEIRELAVNTMREMQSTLKLSDFEIFDVLNWGTYQNKEFGFSIKYPVTHIADSKDIENGNISIYIPPNIKSEGGIEFARLIIKPYEKLDEYELENSDFNKAKESKVFLLENRNSETGNNVITQTFGNSKFYFNCYLYSDEKSITLCTKILSTFKFTEVLN